MVRELFRFHCEAVELGRPKLRSLAADALEGGKQLEENGAKKIRNVGAAKPTASVLVYARPL